ncbi:hypothetical protein [Lentzea flava]|uniref:Excreted virulence factor EspC, type VII ESX diderm n=1 Tax=Lentzea flava TaxID=103732 RepID=A0ABQ2V892_9PSEU|nr:hypothetical protein [Lentzea flava]MCP2204020.1 hypothetical protein [Lentzea flava]GGU73934.1 hypothetical protein GCM10010178_76730 [Lentzea flava]
MSDHADSDTSATYRQQGEQCIADAIDHLSYADETPTEPTELTHIGWAQVLTLRAIYFELRHGHDLAAQNAAAIAANTDALSEHSDGMDDLRKALLYEADMRGLRK